MPMASDIDREEVKADYLNGMKQRDIIEKHNIKLNTLKSWIKRYRWNELKKGAPQKKKKGAPLNNVNAIENDGGAPKKNTNAVKHGIFQKYLPEEAMDIIDSMTDNPLDVLWGQIQIAYAAIVRSQKIMYVSDIDDSTTTQIGRKDGDNVTEERWEVQQAWDKQANFLKAQARAQGELRSMIKQYDELLHKNYELSTEEQKSRITLLKARTNAVTGEDLETEDLSDIEKEIYE